LFLFSKSFHFKGRARAANSKYYLLVEREEYQLSFKEELNTFRGIEKLIEKEINTRGTFNLKKIENDENDADKEVDDEEDDDDKSYDYTDLINKMGNKLAAYRKNESQITCHSAINLINRFI
jgi:methionine synthase II (cobalamin-independent)